MRLPLALALAAAAAAALAAACSGTPVGAPCSTGVGFADEDQTVVTTTSLDCPTRACLHLPENPQDLCTAECGSDDDCDKVAGSPCAGPMVCQAPFVVGAFACRGLCVCADYLFASEPPAACE